MSTRPHYGGIDGGGSHSNLIVCNADGRIVANVTGPSTNHWQIGILECARRIADMVAEAKQSAGLADDVPLRTLGLSLSGCGTESVNTQLEMELRKSFANVADSYVVCVDTLGSVAASSPIGGLVLIAGTGSNAMLRNPDGRTYDCGGWGYLLGDEGSAFWIAHRAVKTVIDHLDGMERCAYDVQPVWRLVREHFGVATSKDMLEHCYGRFDKASYAKLCRLLAVAASAEEADPLCVQLFREAGECLAKSTVALLPRVSVDLVRPENGGTLNVVCVGSVWKSWPLLRDGYNSVIERRASDWVQYDLRLIRLTQPVAMGAVYMAVDAAGEIVPRDYENNYRVIHVIESRVRRESEEEAAKVAKTSKTNGIH